MSATEKNEKLSKKIKDIQAIPNAKLVFQDEVHFNVQTDISAIWAEKGSTPKIKSKPGKDKVSYSGFVIPSTGELFTDKPDMFTFETTISSIRSFLSAYPLNDGEKYYLVMDNAPWHKKAKRLIKENANGDYSDICNQVVFVYLPPYSPDLNPIEQVWRITRRDAKNNKESERYKMIAIFKSYHWKCWVLTTKTIKLNLSESLPFSDRLEYDRNASHGHLWHSSFSSY